MALSTQAPERALTPAERVALSRRPPERVAVAQLLQRIEPGATLLGLRRLKGGISGRTHEVRYASGRGAADSLVLKVFVPQNYHGDADSVRREWSTLRLLESAGLPAPRPLLIDAEGSFFGVPCLAISRLPGAPLPCPRDSGAFLRQLARHIGAVHQVPLGHPLATHLNTWGRDEIIARVSGGPDEAPRHRLAAQAWQAIRSGLGAIQWPRRVLVHDDFWPGNTVWHRGRLTGIVDWVTAEIGDLRTDVAQCRVDLALMYGADWADTFLDEYESATGLALTDMWFWDLYRSVRHTFDSLEYFLAGYEDLGLRGLTVAMLERRLEDFVRRALAAGPRSI